MTLRDPPACVGLFPHAASCSRGVLLDFTGASFSADVLGLHRRVRPMGGSMGSMAGFLKRAR
jgi:hypothetical protein